MSSRRDLDKPLLRKNEIVGFIAAAEDGVYKVAGVVAQEARAVEKLAKGVQKVSDIVEQEADNVEAFVKQVDLATQAVEASALQLDDVTQGMISSNAPPQSSQFTFLLAKDIMDMGWRWNVLRIFIVLLTFLVVLLHTQGSTMKINSSDQNNGSMSKGTTFTFLNLLAINLGPLVKLVQLVKTTISNERKTLKKLEDNVDEVAQKVKQTMEVVEGVAHVVEDVSHKVEEDANNLQKIIQQVKQSSRQPSL